MGLFAFPPSFNNGSGDITSIDASKVIENSLRRFVTTDEKNQITINKNNINALEIEVQNVQNDLDELENKLNSISGIVWETF